MSENEQSDYERKCKYWKARHNCSKEAARQLKEALSQLLDRLDYHGSIDPIREEGPIEDARLALYGYETLI